MKKLLIALMLISIIALPAQASTLKQQNQQLIKLLQELVVLLTQKLELLLREQTMQNLPIASVAKSVAFQQEIAMPKKIPIIEDEELNDTIDKYYPKNDEARANMIRDKEAGKLEKIYHWDCLTWTGGHLMAFEEDKTEYEKIKRYLDDSRYKCERIVTLRIKSNQ